MHWSREHIGEQVPLRAPLSGAWEGVFNYSVSESAGVLDDLQLIADVDLAVGDCPGRELQNTVDAQADASDPERR
jgi:hypothetical protein